MGRIQQGNVQRGQILALPGEHQKDSPKMQGSVQTDERSLETGCHSSGGARKSSRHRSRWQNTNVSVGGSVWSRAKRRNKRLFLENKEHAQLEAILNSDRRHPEQAYYTFRDDTATGPDQTESRLHTGAVTIVPKWCSTGHNAARGHGNDGDLRGAGVKADGR